MALSVEALSDDYHEASCRIFLALHGDEIGGDRLVFLDDRDTEADETTVSCGGKNSRQFLSRNETSQVQMGDGCEDIDVCRLLCSLDWDCSGVDGLDPVAGDPTWSKFGRAIDTSTTHIAFAR